MAMALFTIMAMGYYAQTENPRGIYRMTTLIGKLGKKRPLAARRSCQWSYLIIILFVVKKHLRPHYSPFFS